MEKEFVLPLNDEIEFNMPTESTFKKVIVKGNVARLVVDISENKESETRIFQVLNATEEKLESDVSGNKLTYLDSFEATKHRKSFDVYELLKHENMES